MAKAPQPPIVSVIMPAYNAVATIQASIDSVLAQTFTRWELIIVNDASTDHTPDILARYAAAHPRIRCFNQPKNQGIASSRNFAIGKAQGKWLAFLDSDDLWRPTKLQEQLQFAQGVNARLSYTATSYINHRGEASGYILPAEMEFSYQALLKRNIMSCSSVMVQKVIMEPFPQGYLHEDYVVWLNILRKIGYAHGLNQPLLIYRLGENTKSSGRINSMKMLYGSYKQVGYHPATAVALTLRYALHSIGKRWRIKKMTGKN